MTLTARHHDGFSLYDTKGLNTYDAPHSAAGRDLVREFVDECNRQGIVPFFYHTLIDWTFFEDYRNVDKAEFKKYLAYLRSSVEILCRDYGKIGGIWFDGMWSNTGADWEEDAMYGMIRKYQPDAMIINNTGMDAEGALGHPELDSVTFERGKPARPDFEKYGRYMAMETCQIFGKAWGYAPQILELKSVPEILKEMIFCRRYKANYLLNVGPKPDGSLDTYEKGCFERIGEWMKYNASAVRDVTYVEANVDKEDDFLVRDDASGCYYLFVYRADQREEISFDFPQPVKRMYYTDGQEKVEHRRHKGRLYVKASPNSRNIDMVVRVIKIVV
ncbi:MAG: alpha-L-fucosidase [Clostridia bacterium]|nr:alpha-L-fucosidase [Clostridia bacterium]